MITCKLIGRLGNQAFQIATTIAYSLRHNMPYWIPKQTQAPAVWKPYFTGFPEETDVLTPYIQYTEPSHAFTEIPYHEHVILNGYFQSDKYFNDYRKEIIYAFNFPYQPLKDFVGIHVRRGDYLQFSDKHPPVTLQYLRDAIMTFVHRGYKNFIVCSDDIIWCKKNLSHLKENGIEFTFSERKTEIEDLTLLSCCEHQICSNSSFSWWAHYLNRYSGKQCVMPEKWFGEGNKHLETKDIYFENAMIL